MRLSVIIPAYARHPMTAKHVKYSLDSTRIPDEIIIVNDGGKDNLREILPKSTEKTKIIYAKIHEDILWNYNGACNLSFFISTGDIIALEDTDHIPERDTYENGLKVFEDPIVDRVPFSRKIVQLKDFEEHHRNVWKCTGTMGANQMVSMFRRSMYIKLKGQDERFAGRYGWMAYDWKARYHGLLKAKSRQTNYYWAVLGDEGEPGLKRGLHPQNRIYYKENARMNHPHNRHGILNFRYDYEVL